MIACFCLGVYSLFFYFLCFRFLFKVFCLLILLKFFYCFIQRFLGF
ncbi:hypothetical protein hp2017_0978 [Helicobacter pylori 2017]|nr:hypothetical protein hp2017_0978 [Helicobacter pylori 2017]